MNDKVVEITLKQEDFKIIANWAKKQNLSVEEACQQIIEYRVTAEDANE